MYPDNSGPLMASAKKALVIKEDKSHSDDTLTLNIQRVKRAISTWSKAK